MENHSVCWNPVKDMYIVIEAYQEFIPIYQNTLKELLDLGFPYKFLYEKKSKYELEDLQEYIEDEIKDRPKEDMTHLKKILETFQEYENSKMKAAKKRGDEASRNLGMKRGDIKSSDSDDDSISESEDEEISEKLENTKMGIGGKRRTKTRKHKRKTRKHKRRTNRKK